MKITVVYQYYQATNAPGHSLIYDWTQHLAENGHNLTVVAGETGYMNRDTPTKPWYRRIIRKEQIGKVKVCRTFTYSELHRSYLGRLLSFISFSISCPIALLFTKKPDLIIGSSPPIFPIFSTWLICKIRRIPFIMEVRDLWPESAIQMGILKSKPLINIMTWMEKILYSQAHIIITLTEGIRKNICDRGWTEKKVVLVRCGVDTTKLYPDPEAGMVIRKRYHLEDKKIILYFGALGEANNISVILRAAKRLQHNSNIVFMLVGGGMKFNEIKKMAADMKLTNFILHRAVPKEQARLFINAADLCLVTLLDIPLFEGALPTKLFDYLACGKLVLCGVAGEAKKLIEKIQIGSTFKPNDDNQLAELIINKLQNIDNETIDLEETTQFIKNNFSMVKMNHLIESLVIKRPHS
ncbi:glycosyltransferase family 4 protein [Legionella nagasakiensis]|uniref:glycosyltransferase family 4 protein n=1 Tax=Legionella nagasakiensis TaxID=535290 RepID=UPI0010564430|nr:glycosyltransferase family 4 protein [Legionella nagasakiensis]